VESYPALLLENASERILVVADLHIGWEVSLAQKGIHVPSQTPKLLEKMIQLIKTTAPTSIIFLGDIKHAVEKVELEEWKDVPEFFEKISEVVQDIQVVPGNHDGNLDALTTPNVKIHSSSGVKLWNKVALLHGHAWPKIDLLDCDTMVMAHLHPVVTFTDELGFRMIRPAWVRTKVGGHKLAKALLKHMKIKPDGRIQESVKKRFGIDLTDQQCIVIPSFNDNLGGRSVNRRDSRGKMSTMIGPILRSSAVNFEFAELYLLDGTYLGTVKHLRSLS
jgi:hypothetical protein